MWAQQPLGKVNFPQNSNTAAAGLCQRMNCPFLSACQVYTEMAVACQPCMQRDCALVSLEGVDVQVFFDLFVAC